MHYFQKTLENRKSQDYNSATGSFSYGETDFASKPASNRTRAFAFGAAMDSIRAYRRAQIERLKRNRRHYWSHWKDELDHRRKGIVASTPAVCSCWMCGNPRKYDNERTIQERRAMQDID
jgi:hypothetical protein